MKFTTEDILLVVKWVCIAFGFFVVLVGIFVKLDDTKHNDPNDYPPATSNI